MSPHNQVLLMHKFQFIKCGMYTLATDMTESAKCIRAPHISLFGYKAFTNRTKSELLWGQFYYVAFFFSP